MAQWPGLGERIRQRLVEIGYKQDNGKPDIIAFSLKHTYLPMYVYKWANAGVMPSRENVERLAADLKVPAPWLLFGDEVSKAPRNPRRRGGKALTCLLAALGLTFVAPAYPETSIDSTAYTLRLIGSAIFWLRRAVLRVGVFTDATAQLRVSMWHHAVA